MEKLAKNESGYSYTKGVEQRKLSDRGVRCGTCVFYGNKKCKIVKGEIRPADSCVLWTHDGRLDLRYLSSKDGFELVKLDEKDARPKRKMTKIEAGYICRYVKEGGLAPEPGKGIACGTCRFYRDNRCGIVTGYISAVACCNYQEFPDQEKAGCGWVSGKEAKSRLGLKDIEELCG